MIPSDPVILVLGGLSLALAAVTISRTWPQPDDDRIERFIKGVYRAAGVFAVLTMVVFGIQRYTIQRIQETRFENTRDTCLDNKAAARSARAKGLEGKPVLQAFLDKLVPMDRDCDSYARERIR